MSQPLLKTEDHVSGVAPPDFTGPTARAHSQVRVYSSLEELPTPILKLFEEEGRQNFFLTLPWFQNFIKTAMDAEDRVRIYSSAGQDGSGTTAGMLLMRSSGHSKWLFSTRKLSALANYYSCFFAPHFAAPLGKSRETLRALTRAIAQEEPRWDAIDLKPLDVTSEWFSALVEELKDAGFVVQTYFYAGNWFEPVNGRTYHNYFEGLRSSVRNIAKSKNKKIERSGRVRYEIITGTKGLEDGITVYNEVYAASWKVPEPYPEFIPDLLRTCAAHGMLRLGLAYVDGEPAAAQIWIVHSGVALIYKIAYDPKFRELSVGTYLTTRLMEHTIDMDRVNEVDYLTGDDAYKKDWMSQRRERWGILALNPRTPRGALAIARHIGGRTIKRAALSLSSRFRRQK
jgi:hypothetical protein